MKVCECGCGEEVKDNVRFRPGHHNRSEDVKRKKRETCLKNYGVSNPFKSQSIRDKWKSTMIKRYGVDHNFKSSKVKKDRLNTWISIYGVDNPNKSDDIKNKKKLTNLKNLGVENPSQSEKIKELKRSTCQEHFNVNHQMHDADICDKVRNTCLKNHGVSAPLKSEIIKDRSRETCMLKFGVDNYAKTFEARLKSREVILDRIENQTGEKVRPMEGAGEKPCFDELEKHIPYRIQMGTSKISYFPDGLIEELKLVIEFDEPEHRREWYQKHDKKRDEDFRKIGYETYRIKKIDWNLDFEKCTDEFLDFIDKLRMKKGLQDSSWSPSRLQ
jgi:very-short-patch-repair endonuclease